MKLTEEALATPYRIVATIPSQELQPAFDDYWTRKSAALIQHYAPKCRKGKERKTLESSVPVGKLYSEALADLLVKKVEEEFGEVFFLVGLDLFDYSAKDDSLLVAHLYYYPELKFTGEIDFKATSPFKQDEAGERARRLRELVQKYRSVKEERRAGEIDPTDEVLVDIVASIEGQPYEKGTMRGKWLEIQHLLGDLSGQFLNHTVGDLFETKLIMSLVDPENEGKEVSATVKIFAARKVTYPSVDDVLKMESWGSMEAFEASFHDQYVNYCNEAHKAVGSDHVLNQIVQNSVLGPIPDAWVQGNVQRIVREEVAKGGEEKVLRAHGVQTVDELGQRFKGLIFRDLLKRLAVRVYAEKFKLENNEEAVFNDILTRMVWDDSE